MMQDYFDFINSLPLERKRHIKGYSLDEIRIIEQIYDIIVDGELREFLLFSGRCDGFLGDQSIAIYRNYSLRRHILFQYGSAIDLYKLDIKLMGNKIFFIGEYETCDYFFIKTSSNDKQVYHWDPENTNSITPRYKSLSDYLIKKSRYELENIDSYSNVICSGDLISSHGISLVLKS